MELKEKKLSSTEIYKGKIINVYVDEVKCPNGNISTREVVRHCEAVCVLAFLSNDRIIIEKQYRYPYDEVIYELPAGKIDKNEDCKSAALRELEEETGYKAHEIEYLGKIYPTCAYTDEIIHLYVAKKLEKTIQHLDENEILEYEEVNFNQLLNMVSNGQIVDAKSLCAILYYITKYKNNKEIKGNEI